MIKSQNNNGKRFTYRDMKPVFLIVLMEKSSSTFKAVSLDTFHGVSQNIDTKLQAWLTFLSSAEPKELISMYSEALAILDHNTELYMINELQNYYKYELVSA